MDLKFDAATFETVQRLIFPLVKTLVGFDAQTWTGEKSELFILIGDGLGDLASLFIMAGTALEDGLLTEVELEEIIAKAITLPAALAEITSFFESEEVQPE